MCGACTFSAVPEGAHGHACHCRQCQKWSGGMFMAVNCGQSVVFADGAPTASYKASAWGERVFCKTCGSSMVWQMQDGTNQNVSVQMFDDPETAAVTHELFFDAKPSGYALAEPTTKETEAEIMARVEGAQ